MKNGTKRCLIQVQAGPFSTVSFNLHLVLVRYQCWLHLFLSLLVFVCCMSVRFGGLFAVVICWCCSCCWCCCCFQRRQGESTGIPSAHSFSSFKHKMSFWLTTDKSKWPTFYIYIYKRCSLFHATDHKPLTTLRTHQHTIPRPLAAELPIEDTNRKHVLWQ